MGWPYKLERKREREHVRVLPSLVAHAIEYDTITGAHNTVHAQMCLAGFTVFAWYGKCRRLQYCKTNIDIHNTVWILTRLEGCKVPFWHGPTILSYRCAGYGPRYCG